MSAQLDSARTLLVIDDDETICSLVTRMAARMGLSTQVVGNGHQALDLVRAHQDNFGCVILDLHLPQMDGMAVAAAIQQLIPGIPIIVISGYATPRMATRLSDQGIIGVLVKPFLIDDLRTLVLQALDQPYPA